ncbi:MAG: signal peptide peptidase SppA [Treponema sp.]|nr:signal peptide peptidase SppA [Treponema sp.]
MARNAKRNGIIVFIIMLIIAVGVGMFALLNTRRRANSNSFLSVFGKDYIAALYIEGEIRSEGKTYNQQWLLDTISALGEDSKNKAIMLFIDSPGGGVYEADEAYLALRDYTEKTSRPVYAYMGPLAASGGYYIACAAKKIYANRNTLTGSIGVIAGQSIDATGLFEKLGIKAETFTSGKNKNMLSYDNPLTSEQRAIMQSIADDAYDQFTGVVAEGRGMNIAKVRELADGRLYTAQQAKKNGLIDEISSWEKAVDALKEELDNFDYEVVTYRYKGSSGIFDLLSSIAKANRADAITLAVREYFMLDVQYPAYLYIKN